MLTSPFGPSKNLYHKSSTYPKFSSSFISPLTSHCFLPSVPTRDLQSTCSFHTPNSPTNRARSSSTCYNWRTKMCKSVCAGCWKPFHLECIQSKLPLISLTANISNISFPYVSANFQIGYWKFRKKLFLSIKHGWTWLTRSKTLGEDRHSVKPHENILHKTNIILPKIPRN